MTKATTFSKASTYSCHAYNSKAGELKQRLPEAEACGLVTAPPQYCNFTSLKPEHCIVHDPFLHF